MFDQMKKQITSGRLSAKSVTALVLFGAIILVFVFFGLPGRTGNGGSLTTAARVNNTLISVADLRSESARMEQMYSQFMGGALGGGEAQRQFIQQQALDRLIVQELVSQSAQKAGIYATDAEIREIIIKEIPAFQQDGRFQRDVYMQVLQANQLSPGDFEEKIRKERKNLRAQHVLATASAPLKLEVEKLKKLSEQKINVSFVKIDKDSVLGSFKVPADVLAKNKANPEFMKSVEAYYNSNKGDYTTPMEIRASHILIKVDPANPNSQAQALAKISDIKKRAAKEDFAKLAKEFSEDAGTKAKGGDLGYFTQGRMVPEFEVAAQNQALGQVGDPIKTNFGYHLIKVVDRKAAKESSLAEVQEQIVQRLSAQALYDDVLKKLEDALAAKDAATVDAVLAQLGGKWQETGFFDMGAEVIPKLGSTVASLAAFEVSKDQPLLPRLVRDGGDRFVIKYKEVKTEAPTADAKMGSQLAQERSFDLYGQWIEQEKQRAHIEANPGAVGKAL